MHGRSVGWLWGVGALVATGCATNIVQLPSPALAERPAAAAPVAAAPQQPVILQLAVAPADDQARAGAELISAASEMDQTSVFFETGKADLAPEGKVKLARIANVLKRYPGLRVRVEGNADERGSDAYNMELGAKRAAAARDYLVTMQVRPDQVLVISNGAEKPLATGKGEESYQLNRRDDISLVKDKAEEPPKK